MAHPHLTPDRGGASLRGWLEYVAQAAIDMLDALDAADEGLEADEDFEPGDEGLR